MGTKGKTEASSFFWKTAEELMGRPDISEGTLMGFPCLRRVDGGFFATCDHRSGHLIVKLSRERVQEIITQGQGEPFAPAGRVFKEWALVEQRDTKKWQDLMDEAIQFVGGANR
ncbi:MAG TPA: hypothetical protein EYQ64_02065 [Gemmatimonadetes bacterium]|nr:hypothetical protein [Gemmatimonadota bacterium]